MFDFHEKRKIRRFLYSKPVLGVLVVLIVWMSTSVYERFKIEREMAAKLETRSAELEALKMRAATLESEVTHMQNERGIEEELRNRFDVVKEGEQVVVIVDDASTVTPKRPPEGTSAQTMNEPETFFTRMKHFFE